MSRSGPTSQELKDLQFWVVALSDYITFQVFLAAGFFFSTSVFIYIFRRNTRYRALRRIGTIRRKKNKDIILTNQEMMPWWPRQSNREITTKIAPRVRASINESYEIMLKLGPYYDRGEMFPLHGWGAPDGIYGEVSFNQAFIRLVEQIVPRISRHVSALAPAPKQAQRRVVSVHKSMEDDGINRGGVRDVFGVGTARRSCMRRRNVTTLGHTLDEEITSYLRRLHSDCPGLTHESERCIRIADLYERARFGHESISEEEYANASADLNAIVKSCSRLGRFTKGAATVAVSLSRVGIT